MVSMVTMLTNPTSVLRMTLTVTRNSSSGAIYDALHLVGAAACQKLFTSVASKTYTLWRNDTLTGTWVNTGLTSSEGPPGLRFFSVLAPETGIPKRFYRVQVGP